MAVVSNANYPIHKFNDANFNKVVDCIAIEEPLEVIIRYFDKNNNWVEEPLAVIMRTLGDDYFLVMGMLFSEGIINSKECITNIEAHSDNSSKYSAKNSLKITLSKESNIDLKKFQRYFIVNSSCGVCGKANINAIEIMHDTCIEKDVPMISASIITSLPKLLQNKQSQFSITGGVHASALIDIDGKVLCIAEDVGRHNALDKLVGKIKDNDTLNPVRQFVMCSGRISFDIMQKIIMVGIGFVVGIGAPTSLAIDLAQKFNITVVGFVKKNSYNVYNGMQRICN